ncbi:MAG: segregation/condensation protein A [Chloroflexi bacterium]|nr:segregation/condensation protein A [Chloroflexota bacterium]
MKTTLYEVKLPSFEGPLDLLLRLVEKNELPIDRISLALVTDQYLQHIQQMKEPDPRQLAEFLVVASKLLLIKSQSLLPKPPPIEKEEDEGDDLIQQLLEYRRVKEVAEQLSLWQVEGRRSYSRVAVPPAPVQTVTIEGVQLVDLAKAVQRRLLELASSPPAKAARQIRLTVADKVRHLESLLATCAVLDFSRLLAIATSRLEVIVSFLAVLELIRRGRVTVQQECIFGEIVLERLES